MFLTFLFLCAIIGLVAGAVTQSFVVGLILTGAIFICGLPTLCKYAFVHHTVGWFSARADLRQMESDRRADTRAMMAEHMKDGTPSVVHDNRQIHFHGGGG
jgi:hypothetical protein